MPNNPVPVEFTAVVRIKYDVVPPNGKPLAGYSEIDRQNFKWGEIERLLLDQSPPGSKLQNVRAVDAAGNDLPEQPKQLPQKESLPTPSDE
jgi:hypothetical protein